MNVCDFMCVVRVCGAGVRACLLCLCALRCLCVVSVCTSKCVLCMRVWACASLGECKRVMRMNAVFTRMNAVCAHMKAVFASLSFVRTQRRVSLAMLVFY